MLIFKEKEALSDYLNSIRTSQQNVGFVPTMGALHEGHLSLIKTCNAKNDITVCSIFVNPTQFNDPNDLKNYPRPIEKDVQLLTNMGCDVLFLPEVQEMYPENTETEIYDLEPIESILEGKFRKGHFQGVAQIVDKLLQIIEPDTLYLGQKDFQQCMIISKLIKLKNYNTQLYITPTQREEDGLAMSSRNMRLTPTQRQLAPLLYQCLVSIQSKRNLHPFSRVQKECFDLLTKKGFQPEYIEIADCETLQILEDYEPHRKMVALIAAKIGDIRLIDNLILEENMPTHF